MIQFINQTDSRGSATFLRPFSDTVYSVVLLDSALVSVPVPIDARFCIINGSDYWVSKTGDFTIPTGAGSSLLNIEFEAAGYYFEPASVPFLYFKAEFNTKATISFYR